MTDELTLRVITRDSLKDILRLKVAPQQEKFVASNAVSIAQAHFHPEAWFRAIYAGETPVGFAMLEDWRQCPESAPEDWWREPYVGLWRFMIDARFQSLGFGARAMRLAHRARAPPSGHEGDAAVVRARPGKSGGLLPSLRLHADG